MPKKNLYFIGRLLGETVYLECYSEKKAELAERILRNLIDEADKKQGNVNFNPKQYDSRN